MGYVVERQSKKLGVRYHAAYRGPDKKERTKTFRLKGDAERWVKANETDIDRGVWVDPRAGKVTLEKYATDWLAARTDLRASTKVKYKELLERHIVPVLGATTLGRLAPSKVRAWHATLSKAHPSTAAGAYRLLSTICNTAVHDEVIARSPCRVSGASVERAKERPVASVPAVARAVAATKPERLRLAILLAAWCQLRRGEILGLQRGDVDVKAGTVRIERTWGTSGLGPPKTAAGRRTVAMPANVSKAMTEHLKKHVGVETDSWLFKGVDGMPISPRSLDRAWTTAREAAGLEALRLHDLRHSGMTWSGAAGASIAELMHRAGHSSPAAALRYQHATQDRDRALAVALGKLAKQHQTA